MASWTERLSVFAAVASKVVANLMSKYEKAHPRAKWRTVVIFKIFFCGLSLTNYGWWKKKKKEKKEDKMDIFVAEFLNCTKG